jgi:hypothetical protein
MGGRGLGFSVKPKYYNTLSESSNTTQVKKSFKPPLPPVLSSPPMQKRVGNSVLASVAATAVANTRSDSLLLSPLDSLKNLNSANNYENTNATNSNLSVDNFSSARSLQPISVQSDDQINKISKNSALNFVINSFPRITLTTSNSIDDQMPSHNVDRPLKNPLFSDKSARLLSVDSVESYYRCVASSAFMSSTLTSIVLICSSFFYCFV